MHMSSQIHKLCSCIGFYDPYSQVFWFLIKSDWKKKNLKNKYSLIMSCFLIVLIVTYV